MFRKLRFRQKNGFLIKKGVLAGMRTEDFANQTLIHSLNRGGLYAVTLLSCAFKLFCPAEEHFRIETNVTSIHRTHIEQITKSLMQDKDVRTL